MVPYKPSMASGPPLSSMIPAGSPTLLAVGRTDELVVVAGEEGECEWDVYATEVLLVVEDDDELDGLLELEGGGEGVEEDVCGVGEGELLWWEEEGGL